MSTLPAAPPTAAPPASATAPPTSATSTAAVPPGNVLWAHLFVSYASEDREIALWLREQLIARGVASVWVDRIDIEGGDPWKQDLKRALLQCNIVVALVTAHATDPARDRTWILWEQLEGERLLRRMIPLLFVPPPPPAHLARFQGIDFTSDRDQALVALRDCIGRFALRPGRRLSDQTPPLDNPFVGREKDLAALAALIDDESGSVSSGRTTIAIQGLGGQGKTVLAQELVRRLAPRYPGGVLLETRGEIPSADTFVLNRWADDALRALGQQPTREYGPNDVRALLAGFGELLVLIDDVSEADVPQTRTLLSALPPDATRIITTRSAQVAAELGARVYSLGPLSDDDATSLIHDRLQLRLSARFSEDEFRKQSAAVEQLIERVDGHALALVLASARLTRAADLPGLVSELSDSLERGLGGFRLRVARTVTKDESVAASLAISVDELEALDRALHTDWTRRFLDLGVFPNGGRMDAAMIHSVWGDEPGALAARDALDGLDNRSLIDGDPDSGYALHPLLRAYARQLLAGNPAEMEAARQRWYQLVIGRARAGFARPIQEWNQLALLFPHIRTCGLELLGRATPLLGDLAAWTAPKLAVRRPPADADRPLLQTALDYCVATADFVLRRYGTGDRGLAVLRLGLACARALDHADHERLFLHLLGRWFSRRDPAAAHDYLTDALAAARDVATEAATLSDLGELERTRSRFPQAREMLERALDRQKQLGDQRNVAITLKYLGETFWRMTRYDRAMRCYDEAIRIARAVPDRAVEADLLNKIGSVAFERGMLTTAIEHFTEALRLHRQTGNRTGEAEDLNDMGISRRYMGRLDEAKLDLLAALDIHREMGNRGLEGLTLSNIASVDVGLRQFPSALDLATRCLEISREVENRVTECWALNYQGLAYEGMGQIDAARERLEEALRVVRMIDNPRTLAGTLGNLAALLGDRLGRNADALALAREALGILERGRSQQAFGGRTLRQFEEMVVRFSS